MDYRRVGRHVSLTGANPWSNLAVATPPLIERRSDALVVADGAIRPGRFHRVEAAQSQPSDSSVRTLRLTRRKDESLTTSDGYVKSVVVPRPMATLVSLQRPPQPAGGYVDSRYPTWYAGLTRSLQLTAIPPSGGLDSRYPFIDLSNIRGSSALSVADGFVKSVVSSNELDRNMHIIPTVTGVIDSRYWDGVTEVLSPYWDEPPSVFSYLQGTGGAFNFAPYAADPQELPLSFSLVGTSYTGISISAAGLLTVTSAAAAGTRAYAVRATNTGGKTADHLISIIITATTATLVVYSDGIGGTHATIAAAIAAMGAGDVLELRNAVAGTRVFWTQVLNFAGKVGNAANPYTVQVRDGDQVVLRTSGTLLNLVNCAYVDVRGNTTGTDGLSLGAEEDFVHTAAGWQNCYPQTYGLYASGATHWSLRNATVTGARAYYCNDVLNTCTDYEFSNVRATKSGTNCFNTNNTDARNTVRLRGQRVRVINCSGDHGGHDSWQFSSAYTVVRGGTFSGYWADVSPYAGARSVNASGHANGNMGNGPMLIEGALFRDSGDSADETTQALMKNEVAHLVMRGCYFLDSDSHIWHSNYTGQKDSSPTTTPSTSFQCIYHNTAYVTKGTWWNNNFAWQSSYGAKFYEKNRVQNNLFMGCADGDKSVPAGGQVISYDSRNVLDGYANGWKGSLIKGNQWGGSSANFNLELKGDAGTTGVYPVDSPPANWTANVTGNRVSAVTFSSVGTAPHRSSAGFTVTGWGTGAAGDAPALATVTATTGSYEPNEWIALDTSRPFFDGWLVAGEVGDYVVIGASATGGTTYQIAKCDYVNNRIRLTAAASVTNGHGVWFAGNPANGAASVWDNRGAAQ